MRKARLCAQAFRRKRAFLRRPGSGRKRRARQETVVESCAGQERACGPSQCRRHVIAQNDKARTRPRSAAPPPGFVQTAPRPTAWAARLCPERHRQIAQAATAPRSLCQTNFGVRKGSETGALLFYCLFLPLGADKAQRPAGTDCRSAAVFGGWMKKPLAHAPRPAGRTCAGSGRGMPDRIFCAPAFSSKPSGNAAACIDRIRQKILRLCGAPE